MNVKGMVYIFFISGNLHKSDARVAGSVVVMIKDVAQAPYSNCGVVTSIQSPVAKDPTALSAAICNCVPTIPHSGRHFRVA